MLRAGIHKRWSDKFLLKEIACRLPEHAALDPEQRASSIAFELNYEEEVDAVANGENDDEMPKGLSALSGVARHKMRVAEYGIYTVGGRDRSALAHGFRYQLVEYLIRVGCWVAKPEPPNPYGCTARELAEAVGCAYSFGWVESADRLMSMLIPMIPAGALWSSDERDPRSEKRREPLARFTLALYADFAGITLPELPLHPYESPAYDALLACWRDPDPQVLIEPLLAACDWHTHECMYSRSDRPSKNVDFINDTLMGWPVEVHMVYRLRERLGLALPPELDHPLMQAPLGAYLPPQSVPQDERLDKVIRRAYAEVPGLSDVLAGAL